MWWDAGWARTCGGQGAALSQADHGGHGGHGGHPVGTRLSSWPGAGLGCPLGGPLSLFERGQRLPSSTCCEDSCCWIAFPYPLFEDGSLPYLNICYSRSWELVLIHGSSSLGVEQVETKARVLSLSPRAREATMEKNKMHMHKIPHYEKRPQERNWRRRRPHAGCSNIEHKQKEHERSRAFYKFSSLVCRG